MIYPIVEAKTPDDILLYGLLSEPETKEHVAFLFIHGTASNFYCEDFMPELTEKLVSKGITVLSVNNRGAGIGESWQKSGAAVEKFEDCVLDLDAWIKFLIDRGYKKILLAGHSLGSEKVVYYMNKGNYVKDVASVILLGFSDSFAYNEAFLKTIDIDPMVEAKKLIEEGKGYQYLTSVWKSHAGVLPQSAESYINFFSENSELSKALPLSKGKNLTYYQNIKVPILAVISSDEALEFTVIPIDSAIEILKKENPNAKVFKLENCDHSFVGAEKELANIVDAFIKSIF